MNRRRPFVAENVDAIPPDEDLVLDDQQQDQLVHLLISANRLSNARWIRVFRLLGVGFIVVYTLSFVWIPHAQPIPLSTLFVLLADACVALSSARIGHSPPFPLLPSFKLAHLVLLSALAPVLSVVLGREMAQTAWWAVGTLVVASYWMANAWLVESEGEQGPEGLERLKYEYKGA